MTPAASHPGIPEVPAKPPSAANLFGLDYRRAAAQMPPPLGPAARGITDIHIHINGPRAARVYDEVARLFGIARLLSQTRLSDAPAVKEILGDRVSFMAVPNCGQPDKSHAFRAGFLDDMRAWREQWGARIVKFWAAPRLYEVVGGDPADIVPLDSPWRIRHAELAVSLGMMIMTHVADPDTWFRTRYADAARYRPKPEHFIGLERMLDRFPVPWIGAHMCGSPEDLDFLDGLLERHPNLSIDTSATKWIVRELSRHPAQRTRDFFTRWRGRILFGSDIVTLEDHLAPRPPSADPATPMSDLAASPEQAFDLYASRYFALRTMFESDYRGHSPIADPDLAMVEPALYTPMSAPPLRGLALPPDLLQSLYHDTAETVVYKWIREHP
jgi:hypothetical protein